MLELNTDLHLDRVNKSLGKKTLAREITKKIRQVLLDEDVDFKPGAQARLEAKRDALITESQAFQDDSEVFRQSPDPLGGDKKGYIRMPLVEGLDIAVALDYLAKARDGKIGFTHVDSRSISRVVTAGTVIKQSIAVDTMVASDDLIVLRVSTGKAPQ